jgi:uncharacterized membrane protein
MNTSTKIRIESIDLLKGLIMIIMALDHVRDYFHYDAFFFDPADATSTTLPIFFTRWITHFCAPAFSFLAGLSAYMVGKRKNTGELSSFLFKRGLWLVIIELTVVNFGWYFDFSYKTIGLLVIWSLGVSMIILAGLVKLPLKYILIISCVLIFGHNVLDLFHKNESLIWALFHKQNIFPLGANHQLLVGYPIIPWVAVMALGYCMGKYYEDSYIAAQRKQLFNYIGITALVLFLLLRFLNIYGNPTPWTDYDTNTKDAISFLNPSKYPPSLLYLLMTLSGVFLFLANSERLKGKIVAFISVYGRVPFFYYILHIYIIHILAMVFAQITGFGWQKMVLPTFVTLAPGLQGYGISLFWVYLLWISIVLALYPACKWFDRYKQNHKDIWWLSYL